MQYADDLLEQARLLAAAPGRGRPKQANLRRAVSAAYYAVFHLLTDEAAKQMLGAAHSRRRVRAVYARTFAHADMKRACQEFAKASPTPRGTSPKEPLASILVKTGVAVSDDLAGVAGTFVTLQEHRHTADYDLTYRWALTEVVRLIERAELVPESWQRTGQEERKLFLACLGTWGSLRR